MSRYRKNIYTLSFVVILIVVTSAWMIQNRIATDTRDRLGHSLNAVLATTHEAVKTWIRENKATASVWSDTAEIRQLVGPLLKISHSRSVLLAADAQTRLRSWFRPLQQATGYQGYFIIGPDNINIASNRDLNVGKKNLLAKQKLFLQRVWSGETAISLPEKSDVPLVDKNGQSRGGQPSMFVGAPIFNEAGNVIAIFAFRINPEENFTALLQKGRIGKTGETYAFDHQGRLISNSRFDDQLRGIGLIAPHEHGILNIELRDPGVNLLQGEISDIPRAQQSFTRMAASAISKESNSDLTGYRDYRGNTVVGTWIWDAQLGFGMTTEIDKHEAYNPLHTTQYVILVLTVLAILLLLGMMMIFAIYHQRGQVQAALQKSETRLANFFEAAFEGIFLHEGGKILDVNPATTDIFGYEPRETVGRNLLEFLTLESKEIVVANMLVDHEGSYEVKVVAKDGSIIPVEVRAKTIELEGQPTRVVGLRDITERKLAEKALHRSEVLEQLATGAPLNEILTALVINAEKHNPEVICSVLLLDEDGKHLRHCTAPSLPDYYNKAIDGIEIGPEVGTCAAAAYTGERVIVEDINSDAGWVNYIGLAENAGLRACWSEPIISSSGDILGTFAIYHREPCTPSESDLDFICDSARLAGIAIERKQSEDALRESEQKFRALSEKALVGIYLLQENGFRYVNPRFAEITGYDVEELINTVTPQDLIHPEDWPMAQENIRKRFSGEASSIRYSARMVRKDGELRDAEVFGTQATYLGKPTIIGTLLDITDRKQAEDQIRTSEAELRGILDSLQDLYYRIDNTDRIVKVSPSSLQVTGYRPEELIGKPANVFWRYPQKRQELLAAMQASGGAVHNYEVEGVHKDGSIVWGAINAHFYLDEQGNISGIEGTIRDVTERKQAEEALREEHDTAQRYLDTVEAMIVALDTSGIITLVNRKACELLGYDEQGLIGKNWFTTCLPQSVLEGGLYQLFKQTMAGDHEFVEYYENSVLTRKKEERVIAWHNNIMHDDNGCVTGILSAGEDITERKQAEEQARQHQADLAHMARLNTMGEMATGIAHELNQPLAAISTYAAASKKMVESGIKQPKKINAVLESISTQALRASEIIRHVRQFVKKQGPQKTILDLNDLIKEVLSFTESELKKQKIQLHLKLSVNLPSIHADAIQIEQVLVNLIRNSLEAMELAPTRKHQMIIRSFLDKEGMLQTEITDNGPGIDADTLNHIFEPFFTTKGAKGMAMGMGLSISRSIIEAHGGRLWAESKLGTGSSFFFTLPIVAE